MEGRAGDLPRNWRSKAACRDEDTELFFPVGKGKAAKLQEEEAKTFCRQCDVRAECLQFALDTKSEGVWGGLSEDERRALGRRARKIAS